MAEIPVEKKSSTGWLWWVLLALLGAAVIWWVATDEDEAAVANGGETAAAATIEDADAMAADGAPADGVADGDAAVITSYAMLTGSADLIGRRVDFASVVADEPVGDESFLIGEGDNLTLVAFDERPTPDMPKEGHVDVNAGSRVAIQGDIRAYEGDMPGTVTREVPEGTRYYIWADKVDVLD
ncbi:hypothetical protein [Qipengyuania nanhaisediminis]|uniref:hypothetical protein n=1 Tax=Qipengyuania nanhaisediminis TaxID=604088 RepID=UPI0038B37266